MVVAVAFVCARLGYHTLGVRFDASPRAGFWQYLDAHALDAAPLLSLWHLHTQPPLFNTFLWLCEAVSPFGLTTSARVTFQGLGLVLTTLTWLLARELGLGRLTSIGVAVVVGTNPTTELYENWLYTTYPTAVLTMALALAGARVWRWTGSGALLAAGLVAAALVYLRSAFHPVWFLALMVVLGVAAVRRGLPRRRAVLALAAPVLLVVGLVGKNLVMFNTPGTSSWVGMSLTKLTALRLPPELLAELVAKTVIDPVTALGPFQPFDVYHAVGVPYSQPTGVRVLDEMTSASGQRNMNYKGYLEVERRMHHDAFTLIRRYPAVYLRAVLEAVRTYVGPPTCYPFLEPNRIKIVSIERIWRIGAYGELGYSGEPCPHLQAAPDHSGPGLLVAASLAGLGVAALAAVVGRTQVARALRSWPGALFAGAVVLYVPVVTSPLELGENHRFRMEVEPLQILLTVWLVVLAFREWKGRAGAAPTSTVAGRG